MEMTKLPPSDGERLATLEELVDKLIIEHTHTQEKLEYVTRELKRWTTTQ